jgi:hypothetical protein
MKLSVLFAAMCAASPVIIDVDKYEETQGTSLRREVFQLRLHHTGSSNAGVGNEFRKSSLAEKLLNIFDVHANCAKRGGKCFCVYRLSQALDAFTIQDSAATNMVKACYIQHTSYYTLSRSHYCDKQADRP